MQIQINAHSQLQRNLALVKQQQYYEALDRYKDLLMQSPDLLPNVFIDLYRLLRVQYENCHIRLIIVELAIKHGHTDDACLELEEMMDIDPSFSQIYFLVGKLYAKTGNSAFAKPLLQRAFDTGIRDSAVIDLLPKLYLDDFDIARSIAFFEVLTRETTHYPHYTKTLAELYKQNGQYEKSVRVYTNLVEQDPSYLSDACLLAESLVSAFQNLTFARDQLVVFYMKGCQLEKALFHLSYLSDNDLCAFDRLSDLFKQLLDIFSGHSEIRYAYIRCLLSRSHYTDALPEFESLFPSLSVHRDFLNPVMEDLLSEAPNHAGIRLLGIRFCLLTHDYSRAFSSVLAVIKDQKECPDVLRALKQLCLDAWESCDTDKELLCYCLGLLLFHEDKYMDALTYCDHVQSAHLPTALLRLDALMALKRFDDAKTTVHALLAVHPLEKDLHEYARDIFSHSMSHNHEQTSLSPLDAIFRCLTQERFQHAIERCQQVEPDNGAYLQAQLLLARCFIERAHYQQALQLLGQLIPRLQESNSQHLLSAYFLQSLCQYQVFEFQQAYKSLEHCDCIDISLPFSAALKAQLSQIPLSTNTGLALTGLIQLHSNSITACAIQNTDEKTLLAGTSQPMSFGLNHNNHGAVFAVNQNWVSAESELKLALQMDPQLAIAHSNLGLFSLVNGQLDDAESSLKSALSVTTSLDILYVNQGLLAYASKNLDLACELFQKALKLNPDNLHAQFNLAMIYFLQNQLSLCVQYLQHLHAVGLFFIPIQQLFHYLESDPESLAYWISPKKASVFHAYFK